MKVRIAFLWVTVYVALFSILLIPYRAFGETAIEYRVGNGNFELFVSDARPAADGKLEADVRTSLTLADFQAEVAGIATGPNEATLIASSLLAAAILTKEIEAVAGQEFELPSTNVNFIVTKNDSNESEPGTGDGGGPVGVTSDSLQLGITLVEPLFSGGVSELASQINDALSSASQDVAVGSEPDSPSTSCAISQGRLRVSVATVVMDNNKFRRVTVTDLDGQPVEGAHVTAIFPNHTNPAASQDILITNLTDATGGANFAGQPFPESTNFYAVATNGQASGGVTCKLEITSLEN